MAYTLYKSYKSRFPETHDMNSQNGQTSFHRFEGNITFFLFILQQRSGDRETMQLSDVKLKSGNLIQKEPKPCSGKRACEARYPEKPERMQLVGRKYPSEINSYTYASGC